MLGCSFEATAANQVDDNMDAPNSYPCSCRCSASPTLNVRVSAALDDVEGPQGSDPDGATDLDFGGAIVGVRFTSLAIPPGAAITAAAIQFTADQSFGADNTTPLNLDVFAEDADNAPPFAANVVNNLGTLPRTAASIGWNMPPWSVSESGPAQRTPDMSAVIQEVANRPGWRSGNALVLIFAGSGGRREAESFDGNPARAAMLSVQFEVTPVQALNACTPAALNPNLQDANGVNHPSPQPDQLQADCEGRVQKTFADLAMTCGYPAVCGEALEVEQALGGTTTYLLRVIDAFGQSDEDTTAVGVVDTTAPALSLSVAPTVLSPPNHKLVPVTVTAAVSDICDPSPTLRLRAAPSICDRGSSTPWLVRAVNACVYHKPRSALFPH